MAARPIPTERRTPLVALLLAAFLAIVPTAPAQEPRTEPLAIETKRGTFTFEAEIAATPEQRSRGLMHRKSLPIHRAMLFDFGEERVISLWMKNTYISLDMIFVRGDGTVAGFTEETVPLSLEVISSGEAVRAAIEVVAGTARRIGLAKGDKVRHRMFGGG